MTLHLTYPLHFPAFAEHHIAAGGSIRELLEDPHAWTPEYERFAAQCEAGAAISEGGSGQTFTVGELADDIGIPPGDVVDELARVGVATYWLDGNRVGLAEAREACREELRPDCQVDLTAEQATVIRGLIEEAERNAEAAA